MSDFKKLFSDIVEREDFFKRVSNKTSEKDWVDCENGDWLAWSLEQLGYPKTVLVGLGGRFAELALPIYEKKYPNDTRIRDCIEGCKQYSEGKISEERLLKLRLAAGIAASTAAYSSINAAAMAAVYATDGFIHSVVVHSTAAASLDTQYINPLFTEAYIKMKCADIIHTVFSTYPGYFNKEVAK